MASTFSLKSSSYGGRYMELTCEQVSNGSIANSSTIKWTLTTAGGSSNYYDTGATKVSINGTQVYSKRRVTWDEKIFPASKGSVSGTLTVPHNNDGTKTIKVSFSTAIYTATISTYSGNWELDAIPRYPTAKLTLDKKTETSMTLNWSSDKTIDHIWYSTDDGTNWTDKGTADGTSGSFSISGLTANKTYNVKIRLRSKDSQLTTDSSRLQVTTYDYPYCSNSPNFIVGNQLTLTLYNPQNRKVKVYLVLADGTEFGGDEVTGTSISGYNNANSIDKFYASIPNATSGKYKVKVVYGDVTKTRDNGNTYTLNTSDCVPTFSDFSYKDSSSVADITGNNQILVKGFSNIQVTISSDNKMVANKYASPKNYVMSIDNLTKTVNYSDSDVISDLGVINSSGTIRLNVRAYDSRNNSKLVYKDITVYDYTKPVINLEVTRLNNFESQTTLKINGSYDPLTINGTNKNAITSVLYRYREVAGEWSEWVTVNTTLTNNKFTCNDVIVSLDNTKAFEIEAKVIDKLTDNVAKGTIDIGEAIFFISTNKKQCYINNKQVMTGLAQDVNRTDLNDYINEFVAGYGHNLTNAPSDNLNLGHLISIPRHDVEGYATQLFFPYTTEDIYIRKCEAGVWGEWKSFIGGTAINDIYVKKAGDTVTGDFRIQGNLLHGLEFSSDPSDSFQTSLFRVNSSGYRLKAIRSNVSDNTKFPQYSSGLAFTGGDTHGYIMPYYATPKCLIGGGNADKLKWVKEVAWKQSEFMGYFGGTLTLTTTEHTKITLTEKFKHGEDLSLTSDGGIKIGAGVSKVEVSGNVYFSTGMQEGDSLRAYIYKNDEQVARNWSRAGGTYEDRAVTPYPLEVVEGDVIYLKGCNASGGRGVITGATYLVVKVIE